MKGSFVMEKPEKLFLAFKEYLKESGSEPKDAGDLQNKLNKFLEQYEPMMPDELTEENAKTSEDFLELSEYASSKKDALKYAKKALELDPDNLDAEVAVAALSTTKIEKLTEKLKAIIEKGKKKLESEGYFDDDQVGNFWLITETRPYMRLLSRYADNLAECGQLRLAEATYKYMLKLCTNDNLGVRYNLMHIYAYFEDKEAAMKLLEKYPDDASCQFLLPLSILYYKLGDLREANRYLKALNDSNKDTRKFLSAVNKANIMDLLDDINPLGYQPFTIEEFIIEFNENDFLFHTSFTYFDWATQKLKSKK